MRRLPAPRLAAGPSGQVPLIRADTEPVKVKPEKAGGMNIPDKDDPIYSMRPGANPVEKLLPPPEAPAPRPAARRRLQHLRQLARRRCRPATIGRRAAAWGETRRTRGQAGADRRRDAHPACHAANPRRSAR